MAYTPDPRPKIQKSTRFFARLLSFDMECPRCGDVISIRAGYDRRDKKRNPAWDPATARFRCQNKACNKTCVLGILAWPVSKGHSAKQIPLDQIPNARQLAELRKEGWGWWLPDEMRIRHRQPHTTNLTTELTRPVAEAEADEEE
jgi:hypothetical protein